MGQLCCNPNLRAVKRAEDGAPVGLAAGGALGGVEFVAGSGSLELFDIDVA
jgi:hypothetical protein